MSGNVSQWFRRRVPVDVERTSRMMENIFLKEPIPQHMKNWYFALGATPLIIFLFQVVTGVLLTFYYIPAPESAYESVRVITEEVRLGFWIRGLHHWGSSLMVIAIFLHIVRVFFTRGYRSPRELNWIVGMLLLLTTLGLCFTGYSMVYNQLSYWATTVGTNMIKEVPVIGSAILRLLRGGDDVSSNTLTRFFNLHIGFLPTLAFIILVAHILLVRLHGVSKLEGCEHEPSYAFYPDHFYHTIVVALFLLTVMSALTVILPPGLGEPANPNVTPAHIKPEWYFFAIYSVLKLAPLKFGIYLLSAVMLATIFWPFIDDAFRRKWPNLKVHYWIGSVMIVLFLFFTVYELVVY